MGKFYEQLTEELTLHTRQLAWLHTAPSPKQNAPTQSAKPMTRLQTLRQTDAQPDMPDAGAAQYLLGYLFDAGPLVNGAGGSAPLNWQDLRAWQSGTGIELQPWEARALRGLSQIYLRASVEAQAPDCPAPYTEQPTPDQREQVAGTLRSIFGQLKKAA